MTAAEQRALMARNTRRIAEGITQALRHGATPACEAELRDVAGKVAAWALELEEVPVVPCARCASVGEALGLLHERSVAGCVEVARIRDLARGQA